MKCMACGAEMQLVQTVPDETLVVVGFEHRILQCPACDETERRLVFNPERAAAAAADTASIAEAPPVSPGTATPDSTATEHTAEVAAAPTAPDTPIAEASAGDASTGDTSAADISTDDISTDDISVDDVSAADTSADDASAGDTSVSEVPVSEAPINGATSAGGEAPAVTRERPPAQSAWQRAMARLRGRPIG